MMSKPFFSIVIPTYNRAATIVDTVNSLLAQSYREFEIIIIDDGSTDNTEDLIKRTFSDSRIKYFKKQNGERAAARNAGARSASGVYINFVDSDDLVYNHHLSTAHKFIDDNGTPPVFHLGYDIRDRVGTEVRKPTPIWNINRQILEGNLLSCNGVFIRRDVMMENLFNEDRPLSSLEDWELWVRICSRYNFLHSLEVTSTVIEHDERSVITANAESIVRKVDKFIQHASYDEVNRRKLGKALNRVVGSALSYASLHLAIARGPKKLILRYALRAMAKTPDLIFKKRLLVIIYLTLFPRK